MMELIWERIGMFSDALTGKSVFLGSKKMGYEL